MQTEADKPDTGEMKAIFDFAETAHIEWMWFIGSPTKDWMAVLYRDSPEEPWKLTHRFRYYASRDDPWDGKDVKRAYHMVAADAVSLPMLMETTEKVAKTIYDEFAKDGEVKLYSIKVQSDVKGFLKVLSRQSFAHVKMSGKEPEGVQ